MISAFRFCRASDRHSIQRFSRLALLTTTALVAFDAGIDLSCAQTVVDGGSVVNVPGTQATPWNAGTSLIVGDTGNGTLNIGGGTVGEVDNQAATVGNQAGSNGVVTVDGPSAKWNSGNTVRIGYEGTGSLSVTNGAVVNANGVLVGLIAGSSGTVTIDGVGAKWNAGPSATIGAGGTGVLTVSGGGRADAIAAVMAETVDSNGTATITGAGSTWSIGNDLVVSDSGKASLTVSDGGSVTSKNSFIGQFGAGTGTVTVTGVGSKWTNGADLRVGDMGTGNLTIADGGVVSNVNGFISYNGVTTGGGSLVTVTGTDSTWTNTGDLTIGQMGNGTLKIQNRGHVTAGTGYLAGDTGSSGAVAVDGTGSLLGLSSDMYIGYAGFGSLAVSNSGEVTDVNGYIGYGGGSISTATVDGAGSKWTSTSAISVGHYGSGRLDITNGGIVNSGDGYLGFNSGSTGVVSVAGIGSSLTATGALTIGNSGAGTLAISNGGNVSSKSGLLGSFGTGAATVDGGGSKWTNADELVIGLNGNATVNIINGGAVISAKGFVGNQAGSDGAVTIDGAGSKWTNSSSLYVGYQGSGTVDVTNGGALLGAGAAVGYEASSTGAVTVSGAGSTWTGGEIFIGYAGAGTLKVSDGGGVNGAAVAVLGYQTGSTGAAQVDGNNSKWTMGDDLAVGYSGAGALTISNGGLVSIGGAVRTAVSAGSSGTLNIGAAAGSAPAAVGSLVASLVQFGQGTGTINFNHTDTNYNFTPIIAGAGTINQFSGVTHLTADSSLFTGATNVSGGRLAVNGSIAGSLVTVSGGGILGGTGTVGGIIADGGGIVGPGNSIGTLNVAGDITFNSGSIYQVEVNAAGQSDKIISTGMATINGGSVQAIAGMGNYAPTTQYTIITANGGRTGTFDGVTSNLAFLAPSLSYDANNVYLTMTRNNMSFAAAGITSNQIATGGGVESLGFGNPVYNAVLNLSAPQAQYAFDQLSGEIHASTRTALIEDSRFIRSAVNDRIRAAFDNVGASGTVTTYIDGKPVTVKANTERLAVWGQGFGSRGHTDGDGNAARLNRSTGGFFIGADAPVFDTWRFGAVAGYSRTTFGVKDRHSSGSSDNYHLGLYGGTQWGDLAFRTGAAYTWHDISTSRNVIFPGFGNGLKGDYNAATAQVFGELAYGFNAGGARFEPIASLAYVNLRADGFTERGGAAALASQGSTTDTTFTTLGLRASTTFDVNGSTLTAKGMLGWRHAFGDVAPLSTMRLAGGGDAFSIGGVPITRDATMIEAGLDYTITARAALAVTYGGQFGSGISDHSVKANFDVKF